MANKGLSDLIDPCGESVGLVVAGLVMVLFTLLALDHWVVQPAFRELELKQAVEDNDRASAGFDHELANLAKVANDWAYWDDAYAFARDRNQGFVESNCSDIATLSAVSGIDLLAYYDRDGQPLFQEVYHPRLRQSVSLRRLSGAPSSLFALITPVTLQSQPLEGVLSTEYGLLMLAARPILTSSVEGPSRGVLLMGHFFEAEDVRDLASRTKVAVDLLAGDALTITEQRMFDRLAARPGEGHPLRDNGFMYRLLVDMERKPLVLLRTAVRTEIAQLGRRTGRILCVSLGAVSLVLLLALAAYHAHGKASKHKLEASEARYRQLFEAESDAIFLIDRQSGQILEANMAAILMYGYDRDALLSMRHVELSAEPEATRQRTEEAAPIDGHPIVIPLRLHRKKDGTIFPVEITGRFFVHQGRAVCLAAVRDISERLRMEEQLRFTQLAVDHSADAAFWITRGGRFVYVNEGACRSLGYTREELLTMTVADIDPGFPADRWPEQWLQLKKEGSRLVESVHVTRDGRAFPVEIQATYVEFNGQEYNCAIVRNITKRKEMERQRLEVETLNRQLQKEKSLGLMAGAVAHHFNNQMMIVAGYIHLALEDRQFSDKCVQDLHSALQGANKASHLSRLMLTYLGQSITVQNPMDLAETCRQSLPVLRDMLPSHVTLRTSLPDSGPVVILSADHLQQVLSNLFTNSVEALCEHPGWIELSLHTVAADDIPRHHRFPTGWQPQNERYACLGVADNGCGIEENDIEKLFDPFYTSKFTGRGLGLAVILGVIKAHGGAITVDSQPGQGARFQLFLPL